MATATRQMKVGEFGSPMEHPNRSERLLVSFSFMLRCVTAVLLSMSAAAAQDQPQQKKEFSFLEDLNDHLKMDEKIEGNYLGFRISNANDATLSAEMMERLQKEAEGELCKQKLIEALSNPRSTIGAYVALNQLYPKKSLQLVGDSFYLNSATTPKHLPVLIQTKAGAQVQYLPRRLFAQIATAYWTTQLLERKDLHPEEKALLKLLQEMEEQRKAERNKKKGGGA